MATDLQVAPKAPSKHDTFIERQLASTRRRIRLLDLAGAGLGLLAISFGYGLLLALADRWLEMASLTRQLLFGSYVIGALAWLGWRVVWPLLKEVNPYYAARKLEA